MPQKVISYQTNNLLDSTEISFIDMGSEAFKGTNAYTDSLTTGDDTLFKGREIDVIDFYNVKL